VWEPFDDYHQTEPIMERMRQPLTIPEPEPEPPTTPRRAQQAAQPGAAAEEGVPPCDDADVLASSPSVEVGSVMLSGRRLLDVDPSGPQSVGVRLGLGDTPLCCGGASAKEALVLYRMGISSLCVDSASGLGSYVYSYCVTFEVHGEPQRDRTFFFQDAAGNRWEQRADRADIYSFMFNSDDPTIVGVTRIGGTSVRWEVAKDAAGTVWEPFDDYHQTELNGAYQSDAACATIRVDRARYSTSVGGTDAQVSSGPVEKTDCLVDLRAEELCLPSARGGVRRSGMRKIRRTLVVEHGFAKGSAVEYKSRTAGNRWVKGWVESLGSEMITVLYEVEIQGKMTRMRKGVHVSDLDACLRLYHYATAVSSQQDEQQPGRSSGGSSAAGSGEGALEWSLSRVVEEGQMPPAAPRAAFQSLQQKLAVSGPRVSLEWLRAAGGGPLYESELCSEQLGPLGGGSGHWDYCYGVLWPRQEDPVCGRVLICYPFEVLCQFGKESEWHCVRASLSDGVLTVVSVADGSTHTVNFQSSKTFLSMVSKPKRTEEAGQCLFRVDVADRKFVFDVRRMMTSEEWVAQLSSQNAMAGGSTRPGAAESKAMDNPAVVIGLKGAVVMAPRAKRHPFVAMRLEANAACLAAPGK
jgi:hypothetical protein